MAINQDAAGHADSQPGFSRLGHGKWYENTLVVFLAVSAGLIFLDRLGIIFVFPQIHHDLGLNHAQLGMLMGATSITWALSAITVSFVSDALGGKAKFIIILCMIGFSCATGLIAVTTSFAALLAVRAAAGMFFGPAAPLMLSVAAKSSSPHRLGANVGAVGAGMVLLGNGLAPVLVTILAAAFGWHLAFLYLALPGLLLAVVLAILIKPDALQKDRIAVPADRPGLRETIGLLANRNLILAIVCGFSQISFLVTFSSFTPLFFSQDHTMSVAQRTTFLTMMGLCFGFGNFLMPLLSDRFRRKTCALVSTFAITLLPALVVFLRLHHAAIPIILIAEIIAGGAMPIVVFVIPSESVPRRIGATALALPLAIGELLGGSTTPGIAGTLADHYGLISTMWFCCALGAISVAAVLGMREPPRRADAAAEHRPLQSVEAALPAG